jgi:hypothetical protein
MNEVAQLLKKVISTLEHGFGIVKAPTPQKPPNLWVSQWGYTGVGFLGNYLDVPIFTVPVGFKLYITKLGVFQIGLSYINPVWPALNGLQAASDFMNWASTGANPLTCSLSIAGRVDRFANLSPNSWNIFTTSEPAEYKAEAIQNSVIAIHCASPVGFIPPMIWRFDGYLQQLEGPTTTRGITTQYADSIGLKDIDSLADREEITQD